MSKAKVSELIARHGLTLPEPTRMHLRRVGIWCDPTLSVEMMRSANPVEWRIRGKESGGATAEIGRYVGYCREDGSPLRWLQRVRNFMPNGIHAIVFTPGPVVRLDIYRYETSYDLLITRHWLHREGAQGRPKLACEILFLARLGSIDWELWGKDKKYRGSIAPHFLGRSAEEIPIPEIFKIPVFKIVEGVTTIGCKQPNLLESPMTLISDTQQSQFSVSTDAKRE